MTHEIKLRYDFVDAVNSGRKSFEVRKNDRGYQTGDFVHFIPLDEDGDRMDEHPLRQKKFVITYMLNGWGIEKDYVVFGIKEVRDNDPQELTIKNLQMDVDYLLDKCQDAQVRACVECEKYADEPEECERCPIKKIEKELHEWFDARREGRAHGRQDKD